MHSASGTSSNLMNVSIPSPLNYRAQLIMSSDERDFPHYLANPPVRKRNAWSYIDARDLGQICDLAIKKSGLGFQIFNCTNDTITIKGKTKEFLAENSPHIKITRE